MSYSQKNASQKNNKTIGPIQEKTLPLPFPWCLLTAAGAHATSVLMGVDSLVVVSRERQPYISKPAPRDVRWGSFELGLASRGDGVGVLSPNPLDSIE